MIEVYEGWQDDFPEWEEDDWEDLMTYEDDLEYEEEISLW